MQGQVGSEPVEGLLAEACLFLIVELAGVLALASDGQQPKRSLSCGGSRDHGPSRAVEYNGCSCERWIIKAPFGCQGHSL